MHVARNDIPPLPAPASQQLASHCRLRPPREPPDLTIAEFVALTAGLAGFHPSIRQPLPGPQKLWEGV